MRIKIVSLMILALCLFATVGAQSTPEPFPELEPITIENAERDYNSPATPDGRLLVAWDDFDTLRFYGVPVELKSAV